MTDAKKHHELLIDMACKDGWVRGAGWQAGLRRLVKADGRYENELSYLLDGLPDLPRPDAWRAFPEGKEITLELLEVEVTSGITQKKDMWYRWLWDAFDGTDSFILRIWHMDRFGVIRSYITDSSLAPMVFGMNAGWRSGATEYVDDDDDEYPVRRV